MRAHMIGRGQDFQILYRIIESVVVFVVNVLIGAQRASQMPLHNQAVFAYIASIYLHNSV